MHKQIHVNANLADVILATMLDIMRYMNWVNHIIQLVMKLFTHFQAYTNIPLNSVNG